MSRRYLALFAGVVALAALLAALGRPRPAPPERNTERPAAPVVDLAIGVLDGHVRPAMSAVPKGSRVRLRVDFRDPEPARLSLAGYEDLLSIPPLAPGTVWTGEFTAERPGDDFAWLLDGEPRGRLAVTGSHLVEGHR